MTLLQLLNLEWETPQRGWKGCFGYLIEYGCENWQMDKDRILELFITIRILNQRIYLFDDDTPPSP